MANLKIDLINKINNEKFYAEIEVIRLAQEPNMNYQEKINQMSYLLSQIALHNAELGLVEVYFGEPAQQPQQPAPQEPAGVPLNLRPNQTHGE